MKKERVDNFNEFDQSKHFLPAVDWNKVKKLKGEDFLWEVLEPISLMIKNVKHEQTRIRRLSPGQKALHFFWYLDGQVQNGGFIQFYWNGYDVYLPSIKSGLECIGYKELLKIVVKSEKEYDSNLEHFKKWRKKKNWEWLYENLRSFEKMDDWYYDHTEVNYSKMEDFIRKNIDDFIIKK